MDENMLKKMTVIAISKDYISGKDTINDLIKKFNNYVKPINQVPNNYDSKMSNYGTKIEILSDILCMKKLKDNRADALVLVNLLREITDELEHVIKEVDVNVTTSK